MVHLKNFLLMGYHFLIPKNTTCSLRIGEYGNVLCQFTTHKTMAIKTEVCTCRQHGQLWLAVSWLCSPCFPDPTQYSCPGSYPFSYYDVIQLCYQSELIEAAMAKRHIWNEHFYNGHCQPLRELQIGDSLKILNQDGPYSCQWMKMENCRDNWGNWQ